MAGIRNCVHKWVSEKNLDELSGEKQLNLATALLRQTVAEEKLAGILFLHEVVIVSPVYNWKKLLDSLAELYEDGFIFDWNTSDWLCVKVLDSLVRRHGEACARVVCFVSTVFQLQSCGDGVQREGVAFDLMAKGGDKNNFDGFVDLLLEVCSQTVACKERFAQTGTGWVLRELAYADRERVTQFVHDHASELSAEGIDYVTDKMPDSLKKKLKALVRGSSEREVGAKKKVKRA